MGHDIRYALRLLRRNPGFALTAIGSVAFGIAACTAVFSLVYTLLLRPLPVPHPEEVVSIYGSSKTKGTYLSVSTPDYLDLAARGDLFEAAAAYVRLGFFLDAGDVSERVQAEVATGNYLPLFQLRPTLGRMLTADDDRPGAALVAVLSDRFWRQRFGASTSVIGQRVRISNQSVEIVGVAPPAFRGVLLDWGGAPDVWLPMSHLNEISPSFARVKLDTRREASWLQVVARLRPGVGVAAAQAALRTQAEQLARAYPTSNADTTFAVLPSAHARFWPGRRAAAIDLATVLLASVSILLLIAVLNVANLLIARLATREREISIRLAIGAARGSLVRQLLIEGLVLSGVATVVSVPLSIALTRLLSSMDLPLFVQSRGLDLSPDWRVFGVMAALCAVCGLLLGLAPAWRAWRADVRSGLTSVPSRTPSRTLLGRWDLRHTLAALQIAVCLVSTIGAGLLGKSLIGLLRTDLGYRTDRVTLFGLETFMRNYSGEQNAALQRDLLTRIRQMPGVESAAFASDILPSHFTTSTKIEAPGALDPTRRAGLSMGGNTVSAGYFDTIRLPLVAGRAFVDADSAAGAPPTAIVNETAARRLWGDPGRAVGQRIRLEKETADREIVGVARDAVYRNIDGPDSALPYFFVPFGRTWTGNLTLHVRGPREPGALIAQVRQTLHDLDPSLAFSEVRTLDDYVASRNAAPSLAAQLALAASAAGLALAIVGLYAVLAYLVSQRRTELAIRMSIGAAPRQIVRFVAGFGLKIALAGAALGLAGSLVVMRLLATQLRGVDVYDPLVYASVCALVLLAALGACLLPARRAARLDPWGILRR